MCIISLFGRDCASSGVAGTVCKYSLTPCPPYPSRCALPDVMCLDAHCSQH